MALNQNMNTPCRSYPTLFLYDCLCLQLFICVGTRSPMFTWSFPIPPVQLNLCRPVCFGCALASVAPTSLQKGKPPPSIPQANVASDSGVQAKVRGPPNLFFGAHNDQPNKSMTPGLSYSLLIERTPTVSMTLEQN